MMVGEEVEDVGEGEAVLLGEGDVDAVVGGGGLQLEVEAAAEALAQGEAPGLVEAAAEGGVQDELLAAAFVEEALGDDGGFGGDGAEDGAAVDDVGDELEGGGGAEAALALEEGDGVGDFGVLRSIGFLCASIPRLRGETWGTQICGVRLRVRRSIWWRRSLTPSERTEVRWGASPNQKGMLGGAPWASSTRTRPAGSTRWMRQLVLPRRMTSPGEESTAKCSSRVAIWTFSGWSMTLKMEVSGMAPPLEMAMLREPRRGWRWPWTPSRRR